MVIQSSAIQRIVTDLGTSDIRWRMATAAKLSPLRNFFALVFPLMLIYPMARWNHYTPANSDIELCGMPVFLIILFFAFLIWLVGTLLSIAIVMSAHTTRDKAIAFCSLIGFSLAAYAVVVQGYY